jgi:DNA-binding beta-propeller fold protein YncE
MLRRLLLIVLSICAIAPHALAGPTNFFNFETAPVHPIALGPDGRTLAVCNLPDNRVELFDVSTGVPVALASIPVGLDPVTVRFASSNEAWVVNHISSSISVVNIATRTVVDTIDTLAGSADLVFAGNPRRAWVSCSRTNAVLVIDPASRTAITNIAIDAERPRAMATSPDGSKVYVAIFESGNGTTVLGRRLTELGVQPQPGAVEDPRGPYAGANPPPNVGTNFSPAINTNLTQAPPRVSQIVRRNAAGRWLDDNNADWTEWVSGTNAALSGRIPGWDLPDRDLAIIDTSTLQVTYAQRLMNICMAVGVNPVSGQIAVVGTDATNERRFEPVLNGVFLRVNLALIDPNTLTNRIRDLNPHLDYVTRTLSEQERASSLGDPRAVEWNSAGTHAYVTGMGSRNMITIDAAGARVEAHPIELPDGPTGIAIDESRGRLYVWNRFASSVSVVDPAAGTILTNVAVVDPTPEIIRLGRRHLYDTRKNSGLGIAACASCHVDARFDRLAWDLGDPAGSMITNVFVFNPFHPMKGPMVTQTLQDILTPVAFGLTFGTNASDRRPTLHWRGDRNGIEQFNPTFRTLQANDVELTTNEMAEFKAMLDTITFPPNFYRTFSNTLPAVVPLPGHFGLPPTDGGPRPPLAVGNATRALGPFFSRCIFCHTPQQGTSGGNRFLFPRNQSPRNGDQPAFDVAQLRSLADKVGMDGLSTNSRAGFGFMHDGRVDTLTTFLADGFSFTNNQQIADLIAFLLSFTGSDLGSLDLPLPSHDVPAAAGRQLTFASPTPPPLLEAMTDLAARGSSRLELVLRGKKNGQTRAWLYRRGSGDFQGDRHGETASTLAAVIAQAGPGNEFTATLVPEGSGRRIALDRDGDGYLDTSEIEAGYDPADPASYPGRIASLTKTATNAILTWQAIPGAIYIVERSTNLIDQWNVVQPAITATATSANYEDISPDDHQRFYRVRLND